MSTLHIVAASTANSAALARCLRAAAPGDALLLIGNGVYCAIATDFPKHQARGKQITWFALAADLQQRAISDQLPDSVQRVDDAGFVELVVTHQPVVSWSS
jgi:tRNA 2-thiouridine synthesizing protein B